VRGKRSLAAYMRNRFRVLRTDRTTRFDMDL